MDAARSGPASCLTWSTGVAPPPRAVSILEGEAAQLLLEGDERRIADLVRRTLDEPAGPEVAYRAIGSKVLLMLGGFERVSSMASPFDRWGTVSEIIASFWAPVIAGRDLGDIFLAERLGLAAPYVFVDNPMSYLGGRETYGYAKTMGRLIPRGGRRPASAWRRSGVTSGGRRRRLASSFWVSANGSEEASSAGGTKLEGPAALVRQLAPRVLGAKRRGRGGSAGTAARLQPR